MLVRNILLTCLCLCSCAALCGCQEDGSGSYAASLITGPPTRAPEFAIEVTEAEPLPRTDNVPEDDAIIDNSWDVYFNYLKNCYDMQTAIISPESIKTAFCLYSTLLDDTSLNRMKKFIGDTDYLSYKSTDSCKIVNRLWHNSLVNMNFDAANRDIKDYIYDLDMSQPDATDIKNQFVADITDNFITKTPTVFTAGTVLDAMNIIYFKDSWPEPKDMLGMPLAFTDSQGEVSDVPAFCDYGDYVMQTSTAKSYTMPYKDGFNFTVILPDEGYTIDDVVVSDFLDDRAEYLRADVYLEIPEFESSSEFNLNFDTFNIKGCKLNPDIYAAELPPADITQITKIKFDHEGTEAAAITEVMNLTSAAVEEVEIPQINLICNRPFIYYITDAENNDIAFLGIYNH